MRNRKTMRLKGHDYSESGFYFITLCTKGRVHDFGKIRNGIMGLSEKGCIATREWYITGNRNNVILDEFIVMPDHIHGILYIKNDTSVAEKFSDSNISAGSSNRYSEISPKSGSLSVIVRGFKSAVSKGIHEIGYSDFEWQYSYYDRIIRDEVELYNTRKYIRNNPINWENDKLTTDSPKKSLTLLSTMI